MRSDVIRRLARDAAEIGYPLEDALAVEDALGSMSYGDRIIFRTVYIQECERRGGKS